MGYHDVGVAGQELGGVMPPQKHRLVPAHDVQLVHQGDELQAAGGQVFGVGDLQQGNGIRACAVSLFRDQRRVQAELHHIDVGLHHTQAAGTCVGLVTAAVGQRGRALLHKHRVPYKRHHLGRAAAQRAEVAAADVGHLRHHPDVVVTRVDEQVGPPERAVEQDGFHRMDVLEATAVRHQPCVALLKVVRLLGADLAPQFDQHVQVVFGGLEWGGGPAGQIPGQGRCDGHRRGVDQQHRRHVVALFQRFGQEHGVLFDAVVPEGFSLVVQPDGDADTESAGHGHCVWRGM